MFPKRLKSKVICEPDRPVVKTRQGRIRGCITDGTYIFRGVPYAKAGRFRLPEEPDAWEGIRNALSFGPVCCEESTGIAHDEYYVPHYHFLQGEECQNLNIWTQSTDPASRCPVMVWIHGGLFDTGSSVELYAYDGEELSVSGKVVVVSLSHRLNILGFLDLSEYGETYRYSGNLGMLDIVAALKWIRENIAFFGGDPENITLFGQSGGGQKISALLQMPDADGLYHRAIIESGMSAEGHRPGYGRIDPSKGAAGNHNRQEDARYLARCVMEEAGCHTPAELEKLYYFELARAGRRAKERCRAEGRVVSWCPVYDGESYMGDAMAMGFRKETLGIPVIIGSNLGEFSGNATHSPLDKEKASWTDSEIAQEMAERFGEKADEAGRAFRAAYPDHPLVDCVFTDSEFRKGVMDFARIRTSSGAAPVYTYLFALEMPFRGGTLPWHNCEEAYVLHNACYLEASYIPGVSEEMQDRMAGAWVRFARTGDPGWERYTLVDHETMIFDRKCGVRKCHDDALIALIPDKKMGGWHGVSPLCGGPMISL